MRTLLHSTNAFLAIVVLSAMCAGMQQEAAAQGTAPPSPSQTAAPAQSAGAPAPSTAESGWPRIFTADSYSITIYPPNLQSWSGTTVTGTCPMGVAAVGSNTQNFGTMSFTASTEVDKINRLVTLTQIAVTGVSIPENPALQNTIQGAIGTQSAGKTLHVALDRFRGRRPQHD